MNHENETYTRRRFLSNGLLFASAAVTVPTFINRSAASVFAQTSSSVSSIAGVPQDHVLVVIQLSGGNDGLNTVIPYRDDSYYSARRGIGIPQNEALTIESGVDVALHPALQSMKDMYDEGLISIVQGVGYPNPNRSHFMSMDIWHTADTTGTGDGWLGRYFDNECAGSPDGCSGTASIAIGRTAPLAMQGRTQQPIAFENEDLFRWIGDDISDPAEHAYDELMNPNQHIPYEPGSNADFLTRTTLDAQVASDKIRRAVSMQPLVQYPGNSLAQQLQKVGAMIRAGLDTRVYYVTLGGFDTHAGQGGPQGRHANLLRQVADSLRAFYNDLKQQGNDGRVLTVTFSEFGRRVAQNGSGGTDHGTAAPLFLAGPMVRQGVLGKHPSLSDLDQGDLKHTVDFRSVYAAVLEDWLGVQRSRDVLGNTYRKAKVIQPV
ncbi:MAG: DUF1501 domain-containing protein [Planctomycetota bacterium]